MLQCVSLTNTTTLNPVGGVCPENFGNTTLLTECKRDNAYCMKHIAKGKKVGIFVYLFVFKNDILRLSLNILFCTLDGSMHRCAEKKLEEFKWEGFFKEKPKINGGCFTTIGN